MVQSGLICAFVWLLVQGIDRLLSWQTLQRPIVTATLTGLLLGDLRTGIVGDGICGRLVSWIHAMDTPGNVCPSIHVSSSLSVAVVACRSRAWKGKIWQKLGVCLAVCGICLSTMFLKQHSVVDVFCGALVTALLAVPVYGLPWRRWLRGSRMEFFL